MKQNKNCLQQTLLYKQEGSHFAAIISQSCHMNFKTPKLSKIPSTNLSSPRKTPLKPSQTPKPTSSSKAIAQQSAQNSLMIKLIQTQISSQQQYQNLLIKNKQLQIKILQLQQESQNLKKAYKKASKPLEQIKTKIQAGKASLIEKQKYLEKFYTHLDNKLKSNMHSNLFGRLQKIQAALEQKYQQQKQTLYSGLASQHEGMEAANQKLIKLKEYRDQLIKQYTERALQYSPSNRIQTDLYAESIKNKSEKKSIKSRSQKRSQTDKISVKSKQKNSQKQKEQNERKKRKQQKLIAKKQTQKECQFLRENTIRLKKQKQLAEKESKLLKLLLNIDQEHKKHSGYILSGFKKMFTIKYRQMLTRKKSPALNNSTVNINVSQKSQAPSLPDVQSLQKKLNQKTAERQNLQKQIEQRQSALQKCKEKLNEEIGQYSMLEEQIMRVSNRNNGNREYNYRMTHVENDNLGNHRSTYTSYQQRSDHLDQDL